MKRWRNKSAAQLLAAEWFRDTVVGRGMVPRHRRQSRNSSAKTKFFKSPRRTLSEYPCGGLARTLFSAFRRRKFRQSAADPIGSAAEQICSAAVRRVRGGFRGGIFCSAAKLNLADSAGVRRGPARTQADPGGVRGGIVPPWELPRDPTSHRAKIRLFQNMLGFIQYGSRLFGIDASSDSAKFQDDWLSESGLNVKFQNQKLAKNGEFDK